MLLCMAEKKISIGTVKKIYYFFKCMLKKKLSIIRYLYINSSLMSKTKCTKEFYKSYPFIFKRSAHNFANKSL